MILNDLNRYFSSDFLDEVWRTREEFHFDEFGKNGKKCLYFTGVFLLYTTFQSATF